MFIVFWGNITYHKLSFRNVRKIKIKIERNFLESAPEPNGKEKKQGDFDGQGLKKIKIQIKIIFYIDFTQTIWSQRQATFPLKYSTANPQN